MQQGNMQKEAILNRLRQRGCRITKQRMLLLDIILEEECSSCKEIYYKASKIDSSIGSATGLSHDQYARGDRGNQTVATCTRFPVQNARRRWMSCRAAHQEVHAQSNLMTIPALYSHKKLGIKSFRQGFLYVDTRRNRPFEASHRHRLMKFVKNY
mgnify:CR=1 FL=1